MNRHGLGKAGQCIQKDRDVTRRKASRVQMHLPGANGFVFDKQADARGQSDSTSARQAQQLGGSPRRPTQGSDYNIGIEYDAHGRHGINYDVARPIHLAPATLPSGVYALRLSAGNLPLLDTGLSSDQPATTARRLAGRRAGLAASPGQPGQGQRSTAQPQLHPLHPL